jgi:Holin of 3TMs, for gene-transfer release
MLESGRADGTRPPARLDHFLDTLNRLPRPMFALGVLLFFADALVFPDAFGRAMAVMALVPQPLWWILGGIVGFHFGAREAHYFRLGRGPEAGEGPR